MTGHQNQQHQEGEPSECSAQEQQPLLSLRMKMIPSSCYSSSSSLYNTRTRPQEEEESPKDFTPNLQQVQEDCQDRLLVMMKQESTTYKCGDYMAQRSSQEAEPPCLVSEEHQKPPTPKKHVDPLCREKMCEWSYRVVDHFHASRETVALSMNLLDKFMEECDCDKSAFKLAAMTTLHVATKLLSCSSMTTHPHDLMMFRHQHSSGTSPSSPVISMSNLAELSRGEFQVMHMVDMEGIIMETLGWHVNPPTFQSFCHDYIMGYLAPLVDAPVLKAIYPRAMFFCELALFDYGFITIPKSTLALACVLNAMEGLDPQYCGPVHESQLQEQLCLSIDLHWSSTHLDFLRNRLWYLYSQSTQYYEDGLLQQQQHKEQPLASSPSKNKKNGLKKSSSSKDSSSPLSQDTIIVVPSDHDSSLEESSSSLDRTKSQDEDVNVSSSKDSSHPTKTHSPVSVLVS
eukprot:CAMPEP_0195302580 /NCGR_PEP_ID=MMETSP0707-20130614/31329_1 /TAXON_ID=33640 /ORGANISM="Asterionellopsis glacialis, Strain CCMP134" /LENGTH=456 /DNA_ID=CAMNT_0040365881 /DNA_START=670 /DNA_END=2040 /DNA_ORIENTATION=-